MAVNKKVIGTGNKVPWQNPNDNLQVAPANPTAWGQANMFGETWSSRAPSYSNQEYIGASATNKYRQLPNAKPVSGILGAWGAYNAWSTGWQNTDPNMISTPTKATGTPAKTQTTPPTTWTSTKTYGQQMPGQNPDWTINDGTKGTKPSPFSGMTAKPNPSMQPINDFSEQGITQNMQRMWSMITSYEQGKADQIFSWFMDQLGDINMAKAQAQNGSGAKNLEDVYNAYRNVQMQFRNNVTDPNQIAQNTGLDINTVNTILKGETNKLLTLTPEKEQEINKEWYNALADAERNKNRSIEDFQKNIDRSKIVFSQKMWDLKQQMKLTDYNTRFYWAATGQNQSSGFDASLDMITQQQQNVIDRLTQQHNWDDEDMNTAKSRMLEDYTTNTERIIYSMDQNRDKFRTQVISRFQDIMNQYGVASEDASKALQGLMLETQKMEYDNYNRWLSALGQLNQQQNQRLQLLQQYDFEKWKYGLSNWMIDANGNPIQSQSSGWAADTVWQIHSLAMQQRAQSGVSQFDNGEVQKYCKPDWSNVGQCAKYVNDMWSKSGEARPFSSQDQSINAKIAVATGKKYWSPIPVIWWAVVTDYNKKAQNGINYWHVETIIWFDNNGNLIVHWSNLKWDEKSYTRTLSLNDAHIKWFTRAPGASSPMDIYSQARSDRTAPSNLSPNAQSVWEWSTTLWDYTATDRAKINSELQKSGFRNQGFSGNSKFQELKADEHEKINKLFTLKDDLAKMASLKPGVDTGPIASLWGWATTWAGIGEDDNFIQLDQLSGKFLSEKMKEISWSAISEQEVARLKRWLPSTSMNDKAFNNAVLKFNQELDSIIQSKMKFYGFKSWDDFSTAIWYQTPQWMTQWDNTWWNQQSQWGIVDDNDL